MPSARATLLVAIATAVLALSPAVKASHPERPWQQSAYFGIGVGAGLEASRNSRISIDATDRRVESYSTTAFLFGVHAGFRFNELVGVEIGWHELQHDAFREWGGYAGYHLLHLNARLAWPLPTRQTLLLKLGLCGGAFEYGTASFGGAEDNATFTIGPQFALAVEHELGLGVVAFFDVSYVILRRLGMSGPLQLWVEDPSADPPSSTIYDIKDFTRDATVHTVWLRAGIQFEWTLQ